MRALFATLLLAASAARGQSAPARALGLREAVALSVRTNLTARLAKARDEQARGRVLQAAAVLLPSISGAVSENRVFKENLAALGFSGPGPFPQMLGPFDVFDARAQLVLQVLDWSAALRLRAARADAAAARLEEDLAREQVSAAAAVSYVEAQRSLLAVDAARADEELAQSLLKLAQDNKEAGVAAGIDVARARTREAETRLGLIDAQTSAAQAELRLKRTAGIPLGEDVALTDALSSSTVAAIPAEEAVAAAGRDRLELRVAERRLRAAELSTKAADAQRLPALEVRADEGLSGTLPSNSRVTGSIGAALRVPLFAGGRVAGQAKEARGRREEAQDQLDDLKLQVEEDARLALRQLSAAVERVAAAGQSLKLAQDELQMARDRFTAGVGDNIEVLDAQTALARARAQQVAALAQHDDARINLALALGKAGELGEK